MFARRFVLLPLGPELIMQRHERSLPTPAGRGPFAGPLRAFDAVARLLSSRAAAQSTAAHAGGSRRRPSCGRHLAIPRQIRRLEDALGATHFLRGKRHVEMTGQRALPLRNLAPQLVQMNVALCATSS